MRSRDGGLSRSMSTSSSVVGVAGSTPIREPQRFFRILDREGRQISQEFAEVVLGTKAVKKKAAKRSAVIAANSASAIQAQFPWLEPLNNGSGAYKYNARKLWKSCTAASVDIEAGTSSAVTKKDSAIGYFTCFGGTPIQGEMCGTCGAQICKYNMTTELPLPQRINKRQYAKWCCNLMCSAPVNVTDLETDEIYNSSPNVDLNKPFDLLMEDPNLPEMTLEEALAVDPDKKIQEVEELVQFSKFMEKETNDSMEYLRRVLATSLENKARMDAERAKTAVEANAAPGGNGE